MNEKRKKLLEGVSRGLNMPEVLDKIDLPVEELVKNLIKSVDATKTLFFSHHGVVRDTREVPDHDIQLHALIELAKMYGLFPTSNGRKSDDRSDGDSPRMVDLMRNDDFSGGSLTPK